MTFDELKLVLAAIGVETKHIVPRNEHQVSINCPLAKFFHKNGVDKNPSLSIKFGYAHEYTLFKCFACGEQGKFWNLIDSIGILTKNVELQSLALKLIDSDKPSLSAVFSMMEADLYEWLSKADDRIQILPEHILENFIPAWGHPLGIRYLTKREVSEKDSWQWNLLYDDRQERIVFPVRNEKLQLVGAVGRSLDDENPKRYYNYFGFTSGKSLGGLHQISRMRGRLQIVEGFFDILRCYQWAWDKSIDVVCTWHAEVSPFQADQILGLDKAVSFWYDPDEAGEIGFKKAKELLKGRSYGLRKAKLPKDTDVGELSEVQYKEILEKMELVR